MWQPFSDGSSWRWQAASGVIYAGFVFLVPAVSRAPWPTWVMTAASFAIFVALYRDFFLHTTGPKRRPLSALAGIGLLGLALLPINTGGTAYVIYAAALVPFVLKPSQAIAVFALAATALWAVMMTLVATPDRFLVAAWVTGVIVIVGIGNILVGDRVRQSALLRQAREDVEEMAKLAERERIARDLHDLLGHTLSVIALKSELASKLADRDPAQAAVEIRDVERVSRDALAEVRAAVEGYTGRGFSGELHGARRTLGSAGVRLDASVGAVMLSPRQETVLALALRETITNVVRHARASVCRVALAVERGELVLTVEDDGVGGPLTEGNGLVGMRERVRSAGGTLVVDGASGVRVCVRLPLDSSVGPVAVATT